MIEPNVCFFPVFVAFQISWFLLRCRRRETFYLRLSDLLLMMVVTCVDSFGCVLLIELFPSGQIPSRASFFQFEIEVLRFACRTFVVLRCTLRIRDRLRR